MRNLEKSFSKRAIDHKKLSKYGFKKDNKNTYTYKTKILNDSFEVNISISECEKKSKLIDLEADSEYTMVDIEDAVGEYIGTVKQAYDDVINDIIEKCTTKEVFRNKQTKEIIKYIKEKYNDELEFLWEKFDDVAIWRNKQNDKWYGLLMKITEDKLNLNSNKKIEVIDLRYQKGQTEDIVDGNKVFPGYHMNKKSWITIKLDGTMETEKIYKLIDNSYNLSVGNKCGLSGNTLNQKVYEYLTTIPKSKVVTYKQVAEHLGNKGLARVVGSILHKNPDGDKYPCYKVLNSKGELAEAFVFGGKDAQKRRLEKEGIKVINNKVDLNVYQWKEE